MSKLLSADFTRLRKSKEFWLCAAAILSLSVIIIYNGAQSASSMAERGFVRHLDDYYFQLAPYVDAITAVFISLFLGVEYSDGTIKNKLIAGHTRKNIYLANFLTCLTGSIVIHTLWFIGGLPGLYLIGSFEMGSSGAIAYFFVSVGFAAAFSAIFVLIGTLSQNRSHTVVFLLFLWWAITFTASGINDRLQEPEFNGGNMAMIDGCFVMTEETPNPLYLSGSIRTTFEWLYRFLPSGQAVAMSNTEITIPALDIALSILVTIIVTAIGIQLFRKKDIK